MEKFSYRRSCLGERRRELGDRVGDTGPLLGRLRGAKRENISVRSHMGGYEGGVITTMAPLSDVQGPRLCRQA